MFIGPSNMVRFPESFFQLFSTHSDANQLAKSIILDVRLPRVLLTFFVGAALSVSGGALQSVFRNPLVSPYILGLSSGAAFGAAFAIATSLLPMQLSAFIFGFASVGLCYLIASQKRQISMVSLILAGIIVNGIFTALLTITQYLADPFKLQSIVYWTMGNLHNSNWTKFLSSVIPISIGILVIIVFRWRLNVLSLGDDEARTSGINPTRNKLIFVLAATLASSAAVAVAGIIGLYGLIIPHIVRMLNGPDNRTAVFQNIFFGGTFLVLIDDFSRSVWDFEIPIGVFTMLIGAPVFIYIMRKSNVGWDR